ncbi:MAG: SDR family NAD(P)-dependent oxidoreductase [Cyclobacteriaceae bacterium]
MEDVDKFDYQFFCISHGEAENMNHNLRLLLEEAFMAIENAGYSLEQLNGSRTNVYASGPEYVYRRLIKEEDPTVLTGNMSAMTAGRIARFFNFTGNAMLIDTTCSSSLVSVHLACQELERGHADYALVCSANVIIFPPHRSGEMDIGIMASDGKAKAFDHRADGSSCGEAAACILLKRASDAKRDGDTIHAIIRGSAVNQDANRSSFLTAPSKIAQTEVIKEAWKDAGVAPESIGYIEAHGTGTKLGDPIEIDSITEAFRSATDKKHFCAISSVKTNIGHTDRAAGLSGLIKAVLSLKNRELFPSLHFEKPNPLIDFSRSAGYINNERKDWQPEGGQPLRSGVSAFGLSGTNCHILLEEAPEIPQSIAEKEEKLLFCLSSQTSDGLSDNRKRLVDYLQKKENIELPSISYALGAGRTHFAFRQAVVASTAEELLAELQRDEIPAPVSGSNSQMIMIFSGNQAPGAENIKKTATLYPVYGEALAECLKFTGDEDLLNPHVRSFISHYAWFRQFESCGLSSDNLLGIELGEVVVSVLMNEISLEKGLKSALSHSPTNTPELGERLRKYINAQSRHHLLFVEVGSQGLISSTLRGIQTEKDTFQVFSLGEDIDDRPFLNLVAEMYRKGYTPAWKKLFTNPVPQKAELLGYVFRKTRAWAQEMIAAGNADDWFYDIKWTPAEPVTYRTTLEGHTLLVLMGDNNIGEEVAAELEKSNDVIRVYLSEQNERVSDKQYSVSIHDEEGFKLLESELVADRRIVTGILSFNHISPDGPYGTGEAVRYLQKDLYPLFHLYKAFAYYFDNRDFILTTFSTNGVKVNDDDKVIPTRSLPSVMLKALLAEHPSLRIYSLDLRWSDTEKPFARTIIDLLEQDSTIRVAALRGGITYVPSVANVKAGSSHDSLTPYEPNGCYLITGGASGIGFETAKSIAGQGPVKLIIAGRTTLPDPEDWGKNDQFEKNISARVQNLLELRELGADVSYVKLDVADSQKVDEFMDSLNEKGIKIHGIVHAAGVPGSRKPFAQISFEDLKATLASKVLGTDNLAGSPLVESASYFVTYSSLNSVVPQKHTVDYAIANAFEDAMALTQGDTKRKWLTIGWPGWSETGMSVPAGQQKAPSSGSFPLKPLTNEEGMMALNYAWKVARPHVLVANINLDSFRVNPYFKVLGKESMEPAAERAKQTAAISHTIPEGLTELEGLVYKIYKEVLKLDSLDPDDDFFDIGGHSLNGTQVINRINKETGIELEFEDMLDYATVRELGTYLEEELSKGKQGAHSSIEPVKTQENYAVSHAQRRLWILHQFEKNLTAYNLSFAFEIENLNPEALRKAFDVLEGRHESLRTTFVNEEGVPRQVVHKPGELGFSLQFIDLTEQSEALDKGRELANKQAYTVFDLETGPLMKATAFKVSQQQYIVAFTIHHIISDGWSLEILMNEVTSLYEAFAAGQNKKLPPLRVQYKDYVHWQQQEILDKSESYWMDKLSGDLDFVRLPFDYQPKEENSFSGQTVSAFLDNEVTENLKSLARQNGTSLSSVVLSVFKILLHSISSQSDILVGMAVANRNHIDTETIIGFFINTLLIKTRFTGDESLEEVIRQVHNNVVSAHDHQSYPFDLLVEKLNPERTMSRQPLFNVMYTFQNYEKINYQKKESQSDGTDPQHAVAKKALDQEVNTAFFDLTHVVIDQGNRLLLGFNYNADLFDHATVDNLLQQYTAFLQETARGVHEKRPVNL